MTVPDSLQEFVAEYRTPPTSPAATDTPDLYHDVEDVRSGLPYTAFENLTLSLALSDAALAKALAIPARTLTRRKKEGRLSLAESNQIRRLEHVFNLTLEALGGIEETRTWLKSPQPGLRNQRPLDLLDVEPGARLVEDHLGRIMEGVYW